MPRGHRAKDQAWTGCCPRQHLILGSARAARQWVRSSKASTLPKPTRSRTLPLSLSVSVLAPLLELPTSRAYAGVTATTPKEKFWLAGTTPRGLKGSHAGTGSSSNVQGPLQNYTGCVDLIQTMEKVPKFECCELLPG